MPGLTQSASPSCVKPPLSPPLLQVIREGHPCHLYFDLEFPIELNPGVDGQALTQRLLVLVQKCLW